jgi:phage FluMu protein Com
MNTTSTTCRHFLNKADDQAYGAFITNDWKPYSVYECRHCGKLLAKVVDSRTGPKLIAFFRWAGD